MVTAGDEVHVRLGMPLEVEIDRPQARATSERILLGLHTGMGLISGSAELLAHKALRKSPPWARFS